MATIKLVQLDGKYFPNLALMKIAHYHRAQGDDVFLTRSPQPGLFEPKHIDRIYGSAVFKKSRPLVSELENAYPEAIIGGTGSGRPLTMTVEGILGLGEYEHYDYSIYPDYPWSLGFTQRGCRLKCPFCVVPRKEGKPESVNTIRDIWRPGTERNILLLDNDFFGQPKDEWQGKMKEIQQGKFRVSFNQGINVRMINPESADALSKVRYFDDQFTKRRLYTAWDNLGQERIFFRGMEMLQEAGISPKHLMVYMLIGFDPKETMDQIFHRYNLLVKTGCKPYPMVFDPIDDDPPDNDSLTNNFLSNNFLSNNPLDNRKPEPYQEEDPEALKLKNRRLRAFQRWVIGRYAQFIPWKEYWNEDSPPEEKREAPDELEDVLHQYRVG